MTLERFMHCLPTRLAAIEERFGQLAACSADDVVVVAFSGHGTWCSKVRAGLWVEVFGTGPGNLLKRMVGLGGTTDLALIKNATFAICSPTSLRGRLGAYLALILTRGERRIIKHADPINRG
jgi:hypothetical protein